LMQCDRLTRINILIYRKCRSLVQYNGNGP